MSQQASEIRPGWDRRRGERRRTVPVDPGPSEGTTLLILQMAIRGADADEIEATLDDFGVEHAREAIERILADEPQQQ
jgi:hypothetical protein